MAGELVGDEAVAGLGVLDLAADKIPVAATCSESGREAGRRPAQNLVLLLDLLSPAA